MKAPDKIYVLPEVASTVKVLDEELEYIRKDALVEWLLKGIEMSEICGSEYGDACAQAYQGVVDKINSM